MKWTLLLAVGAVCLTLIACADDASPGGGSLGSNNGKLRSEGSSCNAVDRCQSGLHCVGSEGEIGSRGEVALPTIAPASYPQPDGGGSSSGSSGSSGAGDGGGSTGAPDDAAAASPVVEADAAPVVTATSGVCAR